MDTLTLAFLGDIVGRSGRRIVEEAIPRLQRDFGPDVIIANAENARAGSGLTPAIYRALRKCGIDAVTLGDHAFRDQRIFDLLSDPNEPVARPANLSSRAVGKSLVMLPNVAGTDRPLVVATILGRIYFPLPANDPFECVDRILEDLPDPDSIVLIEAHMETTSEKVALAQHLRGRVAAVVGSHTHVATADARILPGGTAFITDVGMCGPFDSIIGRETEPVLKHMTTSQHVPYSVATSDPRACGVAIQVDPSTRRAISIERFEYTEDDDPQTT